jgi:tripartite-type tricarboxylate transporter receptor subunit TctC
MKRRSLNLAAVAAACATIIPMAHAQPSAAGANWPTKTVRILVGFPAGSTPDTLARSLAEPLSKVLGQAVIVENKPGASGNISADLVAKSTDDHTLGLVGNGLTSAKLLDPKLPFDPARDFSYISLVATAPLVLVAPAKAPEGAAFFAAAVHNGDKWNYGSVGYGSMGHLGMEVLKTKVKGLAPVHIPFKGNTEVMNGLLGGQIHMALMPPGIAMPQVKAGRLVAIGLASGRSAVVPEVPSLADAGVRDLNLEVWAALAGPATLSKAAQNRLNAEVPKIVRSAETRQNLLNQGWQAVGTSPDGLRTRLKDETAIVVGIISTRGIKLE